MDELWPNGHGNQTMLGSPRKRLPKTLVDLYDRARFELLSQQQRLKRGNKIESFPDHRLLNLGCGPDSIGQYEGFLNTDHFCFRDQVDFCLDLREPLPFPDHEWQGILLHHVFEHLPPETTDALLKECLRVLEPGGVLRIAVPDCGLAAQLYTDASRGDAEAEKKLSAILPDFLGDFDTPMDALNEFFHSIPENRHHAGYDAINLGKAIERAGFAKALRQEFSTSELAELAVGHEDWSSFSLYVDGVKSD